jgi:hypothetical protein
LTNVLYRGQVRSKDEIHPGEQRAWIDAATFQRVQALLKSHGPEVGPSRHRCTALLNGLLRCVCCDCAMTPAHTTGKGSRRYRYCTWVQAQKSGWQSCPSKAIPAQSIEQRVVEHIQRLGRDPLVLEQLLRTVRQQDETRVAEWEEERVSLERDLLRGPGRSPQVAGRSRFGRIQHRSGDTLGRVAGTAGSHRAAAGAFAGTAGGIAAGALGPSGGDRGVGRLGSYLADDEFPGAGAGGALVDVAGGLRWLERQGIHHLPAFGAKNLGR